MYIYRERERETHTEKDRQRETEIIKITCFECVLDQRKQKNTFYLMRKSYELSGL